MTYFVKPIVCDYGIYRYKEKGWVQFNLKKITNCSWGSVAEISISEDPE